MGFTLTMDMLHDFFCNFNHFYSIFSNPQGKLPAMVSLNGHNGEPSANKRRRIEPSNGEPNNHPLPPPPPPQLLAQTAPQAMVCSMNDLMEALRAQQQQQRSQFVGSDGSSPTPKVTTAIMMDANSAKTLRNQILAAAAAGQVKIEVGGTMPAPMTSEQALDMSVS